MDPWKKVRLGEIRSAGFSLVSTSTRDRGNVLVQKAAVWLGWGILREKAEFRAAGTTASGRRRAWKGGAEGGALNYLHTGFKSMADFWTRHVQVRPQGAQWKTAAGRLAVLTPSSDVSSLSSAGETVFRIQVLQSEGGWANNMVFPLISHGTKRKTQIDPIKLQTKPLHNQGDLPLNCLQNHTQQSAEELTETRVSTLYPHWPVFIKSY